MDRILVIGAHYDDAELGAGGTMAKWSALGKKVFKVTLTDNVTLSKNLALRIEGESSKISSQAACKILGVQEIEYPTFECCRLKYSKEAMQNVENIIFDYEIDTVLMHFADDYNQDHIEAHKISITVARHCKTLLMYQSNAYQLPSAFYPSVFSDISDYAQKKYEALCQYEDQHNRFDRLFEIAMERNRIWGYANENEFSEGFIPIKVNI